MQDQVASLGGRGALINAQRDSAENGAGARARDRRATCGCSTSLRNGSRPAGSSTASAQRPDRPLRRRRGPLREPMGPRLPTRLFPARRGRPGARRHGCSSPRPRPRPRCGGRDPPARAPRPGSNRDRVRRPELLHDVVAVGSSRAKRDATLALHTEPDGLPAIVYAGTRKKSDETAAWLSRELDVRVPAYHAGLEREPRAGAKVRSWPPRRRSSSRRTRSAWASTRPTCARSFH